jgi:hypothetical protein
MIVCHLKLFQPLYAHTQTTKTKGRGAAAGEQKLWNQSPKKGGWKNLKNPNSKGDLLGQKTMSITFSVWWSLLLKDYESLVFWKSPIVVITIMIPNPSFLLIVVSCDFMIHQLMAKLREYGRTHIFGYYYPAFRQTQVIDLDLPKTFKIANGSFFWGTWLNPYSGKWLANTG